MDYSGKSFRKDKNTLVIDGGDMLQGGPTAAFMFKYLRSPEMAAEVLNGCGYDAVTIGNHDLNYGIDFLSKYLESLDAKCICANIEDVHKRLNVCPYSVFTLGNGLRIALIGMCTDAAEEWEPQGREREIRFSSSLEAAKTAYGELQNSYDILIGVYHGGYSDKENSRMNMANENIAELLCENIPFDILLTGHQHICRLGEKIGNTLTVQPGCYGKYYAEISGTYDDGVIKMTSRLVRADTPSEALGSNPHYAELKLWEDKPVCVLQNEIPVGDRVDIALNGSSFADLINEIQMRYTGAQISVTNIAGSAVGFPRTVRYADVFRAYPNANTLYTVRCTGEILRKALERNAIFLEKTDDGYMINPELMVPKERLFHFDFYSGIDYMLDYSAPAGERVAKLCYNGRPVTDTDSFSLCINSYRYAGGDGYSMFRECEVIKEYREMVSEIILEALESGQYKTYQCGR